MPSLSSQSSMEFTPKPTSANLRNNPIRNQFPPPLNYRLLHPNFLDGRGKGFTLRATNGQVWQVQVQDTQPVALSRGDVVRVFGPTRNTTVLASGLRILQNR